MIPPTNGGLEYEQKVRKTLNDVNLKTIEIAEDQGGAFNAHVPDLFMKYNGHGAWIEIKMNGDAQMGGTSLIYNDGSFSILAKNEGKTDDSIVSLIMKELTAKNTKEHIDILLRYIKEDGHPLHSDLETVPFVVKKDRWADARKAGLLKPINLKIKHDSTFIYEHYANKSCNYIQVGGQGLFYLQDNPWGLDIPRLECDIQLEIRLRRSGSTLNKTYGVFSAGVGLAVQGRLKGKNHSPHSLDDPNSVINLFGD